ncbi:MAG: hypothetical protein COA58_15655 [Bacteroidetes bacterium]|nr:MAG: hypothetical protein COA58_15655 [Bacteroidota bacterium]
MKVNFNLRSASSEKETPINMVMRWTSQRLVCASKKSINPKYWNFDKQQAKKSLEGYSTFNTNLNNLETKIFKTFEEFISDNGREPNVQELREFLAAKVFQPIKPKIEKKTPTLLELILIKLDIEKRRLVSEGKGTSRTTTLYSYRRLHELLLEFQNKTKIGVNYQDISLDWYYEFKDFLNSKSYATNYQGKIIKDIKTILNLALEKGYSTNRVHKNSKFKKDQVKTFHTYLNEFEIEQLYQFDFSENKRLEKVRDLFVLACRTGLRISDFKRIKKDHIIISNIHVQKDGQNIEIEREFLRILTQKTKTEVDIPLHSNVEEILLKYDYKVPFISTQNFNTYVKEVCKEAGLTEVLIYTKTQGSETKRIERPKYGLCSSHTGRRSFATNHYMQGFPILSIMAITGHSKVKDFKNYIVLGANEHAKVLASHYYRLEEEKKAVKNHLKIAR